MSIKTLIRNLLKLFGYKIIFRRLPLDEKTKDALRLKEYYRKGGVIKLHFGCGPRILKGWINIDLFYTNYDNYLKYYKDEFYGPDIRGCKDDFFRIDITKTPLPLPDNSVDVIFHEDFIEHLSQRDQYIFLVETLRVLKKGGVHRINTPNLLSSLKVTSDFSKGSSVFDTSEWDKSDHISVLTKNTLKEMSEVIGYSKIIFQVKDRSLAKNLPKEYRPADDRDQDGNIFVDLVK